MLHSVYVSSSHKFFSLYISYICNVKNKQFDLIYALPSRIEVWSRLESHTRPRHTSLAFFFFLIYLFIYFWVCWVFVSVRGLSLVVASGGHSSSQCMDLSLSRPLVVEHKLQTRRLSNCGSRAQLLYSMWDLPRPGLEPVSPALAGRFSTTAPPGKPQPSFDGYIGVWYQTAVQVVGLCNTKHDKIYYIYYMHILYILYVCNIIIYYIIYIILHTYNLPVVLSRRRAF